MYDGSLFYFHAIQNLPEELAEGAYFVDGILDALGHLDDVYHELSGTPSCDVWGDQLPLCVSEAYDRPISEVYELRELNDESPPEKRYERVKACIEEWFEKTKRANKPPSSRLTLDQIDQLRKFDQFIKWVESKTTRHRITA